MKLRTSTIVLISTAAALAQSQPKPPAENAAAGNPILNVLHVIGMQEAKNNARGKLTVHNGILRFDAGTAESQVPVKSIEDVATGQEVKQAGGTMGAVTKMAVPYGGGRMLSLFMRDKVDILTVVYRDANRALHGAIFALPRGSAAEVEKELAIETVHAPSPAPAAAAPPSTYKHLAAKDIVKWKKHAAPAILIEPIHADMNVPAEFRMAIYESLVDKITKTGEFQQVFRDGDKRAEGVPDIVRLRTTISRFEEGSQTKREVTTVSGATSIDVNTSIAAADGHLLLNEDVTGRVRFFGENLRATNDLAKRIAKLVSSTQ